MRQETITLSVAKFLSESGWCVKSVDYPQSGCGVALRPRRCKDKNRGKVVPDVIAVRGHLVLFVESNTRCTPKDIENLARVKSEEYLHSLQEAVEIESGVISVKTAFAVASDVSLTHRSLTKLKNACVDFLIRVNESGECEIKSIEEFPLRGKNRSETQTS